MDPNNINLDNLSKSFEYTKLASEIDSCRDIEQIKNMKNFLNITSFSNKPKIVLIDGSEYLNLSSSNSLLKSLEENLNNVFFILVHDIKKKLLTTIKSRCIQFKFFLNNFTQTVVVVTREY